MSGSSTDGAVPSAEEIVRISNVSFRYATAAALNGIDFSVTNGHLFAVLGPNGGGKSTLFRILCTLLPPQTGTVRIGGLDVMEAPRQVRRLIGVVFQSNSLDPHLSAEENLRHQGHLFGLAGSALKEHAALLLERFGLKERRNELVRTLSGGLRRRVELAKSLLHRPRLLILDEPTAGLDPSVRREFWRYLEELRKEEGITVLFTTHLLEETEQCDALVVLSAGRVVAAGSPDTLKGTIQGDVVIVRTPDPERLKASLAGRFSCEMRIVDSSLRMALPRGHELVRELMESYPDQIESVTVGKPTLEDVLVSKGQFSAATAEN